MKPSRRNLENFQGRVSHKIMNNYNERNDDIDCKVQYLVYKCIKIVKE